MNTQTWIYALNKESNEIMMEFFSVNEQDEEKAVSDMVKIFGDSVYLKFCKKQIVNWSENETRSN
jgi:hypothetical protein